MTVDKSIENLVLLKKLEDCSGDASGNTNSVASQSLECAVDTMRKYQKIKTVIEMWKENRKRFTLGDDGSKDEYLRQISEVLEEGES